MHPLPGFAGVSAHFEGVLLTSPQLGDQCWCWSGPHRVGVEDLGWGWLRPCGTSIHPHDGQGQQGPRGIRPDPPIRRLSWGPGPPSHDHRGSSLQSGQLAGDLGPHPHPAHPLPGCPAPAAPPQDGRTFLRSVSEGRQGTGQDKNPGGYGGQCQPGALFPPVLCLTSLPCLHRPWAPCPAPESAPRLPCLRVPAPCPLSSPLPRMPPHN